MASDLSFTVNSEQEKSWRSTMGHRTPNIDRVAEEGVAVTDYYGQQSCTAGRAIFITGQNPLRTGLTKVEMPGF